MEAETQISYKYRKWPLFLPSYLIFGLIYFFAVYSFRDFSYRSFTETLIMTIFVPTAPMLAVFYLKIVKIKEFLKLFLQLLYHYLISLVLIFLLMYTYLEGEEWFGAIFLLFSLFVYYLFFLISSYIYFKIKSRRNTKHAPFA